MLAKPVFPALDSVFRFGFLSSFYGWITFSITLFSWLLWEPGSFWISVTLCSRFSGLYFSFSSLLEHEIHIPGTVWGAGEITWGGTKGFWNLKSRITSEKMLCPSASGSQLENMDNCNPSENPVRLCSLTPPLQTLSCPLPPPLVRITRSPPRVPTMGFTNFSHNIQAHLLVAISGSPLRIKNSPYLF